MRAVDDRDERQDDDHRREVWAAVREERQREADEPVAAELEHDRCQDHRSRRRGLRVRVGQPGVEREHRDLDGEGEEERQEGEQLQAVGESAGRCVDLERLEVEGAGPGAAVPCLVGERRGEDRDQHQQRSDQRVEDELDRRVDPVRAAPDPDDQVHRDEHELPEDVEEEEVEGEEDADQTDLEDEERDHVFLDPRLDRLEAGQDARSRSGSSSARPGRPTARPRRACTGCRRRDPVERLDELEPGAREVSDEQDQRDREHDQAGRQGQRSGGDAGAAAMISRRQLVGRGFSGDQKHLTELIKQAIQHKGFSFLDIFSPCVTYNKDNTFQWFRPRMKKLEEDSAYDSRNWIGAMEKSQWGEKIPIGKFFESTDVPTLEETEPVLRQALINRELHIPEDVAKQFVEELM